eukprot:TRINITY_DN42158_c0_g1_i1.p1 TRINITY_DN42158_c0_g1~~TRINITY_DN42158_c0_g1_i1.p1  ORF type:complete len:450 (-),score=64.86 TRINITY_DN42158_c0_g1_i1:30-1379(-)
MANASVISDAVPVDTVKSPISGDVSWILTSTALVFFMTTGLGFFYGGLVRDSNIINTMMMSIISIAAVSIGWAVIGFSLAFGDGGPLIGSAKYFMLDNLEHTMWDSPVIAGLNFATFQMTFAIIAAAIISGSVVERMNFLAYSIMIFLWGVLIYAPICHWVWGKGGWIEELGALDFAGGTVVHISSGVSGFVAAAVLGARKHVEPEPDAYDSNPPFVILGASILWFGWMGFNGGSAYEVTDGGAALAITTTNLAAACSMTAWVGLERFSKGHITSIGAMVGGVAGLVCITPCAGYVTPKASMLIGFLAAPFCYFAVSGLNRFSPVDDSLDAFGLHGAGGIWGALLTGIFANEGGLIYTGSFLLLGKQILGALAAAVFAAAGTALILLVMGFFLNLRVPEEVEKGGLDEHTHREAYRLPTRRSSIRSCCAPDDSSSDEDVDLSQASTQDV